MRLGIDLSGITPGSRWLDLAKHADQLGYWALHIATPAGVESVAAGELATGTSNIHLAVHFDLGEEAEPTDSPLVVAEELAILDHLSQRRVLGVIAGPHRAAVESILAGEVYNGVMLAPPPAQTRLDVWEQIETIGLTGNLSTDQAAIDTARDDGVRHAFLSWPGNDPSISDLATAARHLVTRALTPTFPQLVADLADEIAPIGPEQR